MKIYTLTCVETYNDDEMMPTTQTDVDEYNVSTADGMNLWIGQIDRFVISD